MNPLVFIDELAKQKRFIPDIEQSVFADDGYLQVCDTESKSPDGMYYQVQILWSTVREHDYKTLLKVMEGGNTTPLKHLTRIVGYYSIIDNWNDAKKKELKDRNREDIVDAIPIDNKEEPTIKAETSANKKKEKVKV